MPKPSTKRRRNRAFHAFSEREYEGLVHSAAQAFGTREFSRIEVMGFQLDKRQLRSIDLLRDWDEPPEEIQEACREGWLEAARKVFAGRLFSPRQRRPLHALTGRALRRRVAWMWRHRSNEDWANENKLLEWIQDIPNGYGGGEIRYHFRTPRQVRAAARKARMGVGV